MDIGFGTGILSKKLYDEGVEIYGIDFSSEMVKTAQEKMPNAKLFQCDFLKGLPQELSDKKFDFIISTYAVHHLTNEEKTAFIKELRGHLNPQGKVLLGDVAFETQQDMDSCARQAGDKWDNEEIYIVKENLQKDFPDLDFKKISFCGAVVVIS